MSVVYRKEMEREKGGAEITVRKELLQTYTYFGVRSTRGRNKEESAKTSIFMGQNEC
jgi:hypothetical protein